MASIELEPAAAPSRWNGLRAIFAILVRAIGVIATLMLAVAVGLWSSRYMVSRGSPLSVEVHGPWEQWSEIGREAGLHFCYAGNLPGGVSDWENTRCPNCNEMLIERYGLRRVIRFRHSSSSGR